MDKSFSNIKKDIGSLSSWITHFKGKHDEHEGSFDKIMNDIENIKDMFKVGDLVKRVGSDHPMVLIGDVGIVVNKPKNNRGEYTDSFVFVFVNNKIYGWLEEYTQKVHYE